MDIEPYRVEAERLLKEGDVRDIDFAGSTYQVEVHDSTLDETLWPFLQFDEKEAIRDAFCSCPSEDEEGCVHLAAAYLRIYNGKEKPLHLRFEHAFWNVLYASSAHSIGYEEELLEQRGEGNYGYGSSFSIEAKSAAGRALLTSWIEERQKATPENSISFSNQSQEEIEHWREGRPSPQLRYALSFWCDLARWALIHQDKASVVFEEAPEGLPTCIVATFPDFLMRWEVTPEILERLIPTLNTVHASLKLVQTAGERVVSMRYEPKEACFYVEHGKEEGDRVEGRRTVGEWVYLPKKGFTNRSGSTLITRDKIEKGELPEFLDTYADEVRRFVPVAKERVKLSYAMHFDADWNWHFAAYVQKRGDLQRPGALLVDGWAYLPDAGFIPIEEMLFDQCEAILSPAEVSRFVNRHRIWLNGHEGFQTHLASIESQLTYTLTPENLLRFHTKLQPETLDTHDFGEWIFYAKLGFFSKKHARLGTTVRPGIEVHERDISRFIMKNREELENISGFFTARLPIEERGLEVSVKSETALHVKPVYKGDEGLKFFGDFAYIEGEGFCELPPPMRLPEGYQSEKTISQSRLHAFLADDLPQLQKYTLHLDPRLRAPLRTDFEVRYLVRTAAGRLKAQIMLLTEYGEVPMTQVAAAYAAKQRYLFSEGGLLDLHRLEFQWVRQLGQPAHPELQTLELSTLEFIRLDATFSLLSPSESDPTSEITRRLIHELREFTAHEPANTRGLESELRLYQQTGLQWLWFLYKNGLSALLCDDMGLGKTHQAMALMAATLNQKEGEKKRFLVVCPTSVIYHWQDKLATFLPRLKVHTFHGLKRSLKNLPKEGVILTTYGVLRLEKKAFEKIPFEVAIYDEVQVAKNASSRVHQALTHVQARMRIGLTGTPIENNLRELKALFDVVLPGYMPSEARFREFFINPIEREFDEEKKGLLTQLIRPFVLRRRKAEVLQELPEKSEDKSYCDLSKDQLEQYEATLSKDRDELIAQLRDRETSVNIVHVFALLSRLKQVCNHPALVEKDPQNYKKYASGKWDLFVELMEEARESDQKVVVFSQYLYMLDIMESFLKERGWGYAQIRGDTVDRRGELKRFQEDPDCKVFIGSLQAAGLGIDLTAASVVILYDRWWNAARENQAIDRVHRIGQKWGVQVYKLITKGTIEEKIDQMITKKGQLMEEIVTADDQAVLKKFSRSELIDLLSYSPPEEDQI